MRAMKMIPTMEDKPYGEELACLKLTSLESRRLRGDLIGVFKLFKEPLTLSDLFDTITRGLTLKTFKNGCRLDCRKFSFSHRIVNMWNSLNEEFIAVLSKELINFCVLEGLYRP